MICTYAISMTLDTVVEDDFLCHTSSQFSCTCTCHGCDHDDCRVDDCCSALWGHRCSTLAQKEMKVCQCAQWLCCTMNGSNLVNISKKLSTKKKKFPQKQLNKVETTFIPSYIPYQLYGSSSPLVRPSLLLSFHLSDISAPFLPPISSLPSCSLSRLHSFPLSSFSFFPLLLHGTTNCYVATSLQLWWLYPVTQRLFMWEQLILLNLTVWIALCYVQGRIWSEHSVLNLYSAYCLTTCKDEL